MRGFGVRLERTRDGDAAFDRRAASARTSSTATSAVVMSKTSNQPMWPIRKSPRRHVSVAAGNGDSVAVTEREHELLRVRVLRRQDRGDDRRALVVGREQLEAHRLRALAAGAPERGVARERVLEPFVEDAPRATLRTATVATAGVKGC